MNLLFLTLLLIHVVAALAQHPFRMESDVKGLPRGVSVPHMPFVLFICWALCTVGWPQAVTAGLLTFFHNHLYASVAITITGAGVILILMNAIVQRGRRKKGQAVARKWYMPIILLLELNNTVVVVLACYIAWRSGVLHRGFFSPLYIIPGILIGHFIYLLSLMMTQRSLAVWADFRGHFLNRREVGNFLKENPSAIFGCIDFSIKEEVVYRVACQTILLLLLQRPWLAIILTAFLFSVIHGHFFASSIIESTEFLLFALILGGVYYATNSLVLVVMIHAMRNLNIIYLEFLFARERHDDAETALHAVEKAYMRQNAEIV